jgi:hypothetical protein
MDRYTVFKQTGTHADVLAALGAADVLRSLEPRIVESDDRFEVQLRRRLLASDLDAVDPGYSYLLRPNKTAPHLPPERIVQTHAAVAGQNAVTASAAAAEHRMYSILGRMKAYGGPNQLVSRFAKMRREAWEAEVWECLHGSPDFVFSSPLVQLFNPHSARGYALLKPSGTNRNDKTKDRWVQPFIEWLRFRGYFEGSAGWFASGDLRLFCPVPSDIPYEQFMAAIAGFRDLRLGGTAAKMDCRAVLGLTRLLIEGAGTYRPPNRWVRGVWVTHYKDMGQADTLMAMEHLAIPDWLELRTSQQAQWWLETLDEHDTILRRLTDSHSDEFALLKQYRRIFQAKRRESIAEFLEFLSGYGMLLFRRRAADHWLLPQFALHGVTRILGGDPDLGMALGNPGFLAIAAAVRSSTVGAQAARHNGKPDHREIRYGLFSGIHRAGLLGSGELLTAVSSFVSGFNREATGRRARGLPSSHIRNGEMEAFAGLMDRLPSRVAGTLLCGLASCVRDDSPPAEIESESVQAIWV